MKSEPKPFASLSSGLLARKGAARPAMRPQGFGGQAGGGLEDLGWNDMGFEPPKPADTGRDAEHDAFGEDLTPHPLRNPIAALTPIGSPVHDQQAEIADRLIGSGGGDEDFDEEYDDTAELVDVEDVARMPKAAEPAEVEDVPSVPEVASVPVAVQPARPRRQPKPRAAAGSNGKAAFTLRLDPSRHLKLRLACAVSGRSAQQIVTDAVDRLLAEMPELDSMAERAPAKRARA
jgi:hypothetical protein